MILALGKLGGRELTIHSDLDLVIVYDGAPADSATFMAKQGMATAFERLLEEPTADGIAYHVDTRLRPEGKKGALAMPLVAFERYLRERAEIWERLAWTRFRRDRRLDRRSPTRSRRRCTRSSTDRGTRRFPTVMSDIRRRMERELAQPGGAHLELKIGRGGLADVDFAVQMIQIREGSTRAELRVRGTREALARSGRHLVARAAGAARARSGLPVPAAPRALRAPRRRRWSERGTRRPRAAGSAGAPPRAAGAGGAEPGEIVRRHHRAGARRLRRRAGTARIYPRSSTQRSRSTMSRPSSSLVTGRMVSQRSPAVLPSEQRITLELEREALAAAVRQGDLEVDVRRRSAGGVVRRTDDLESEAAVVAGLEHSAQTRVRSRPCRRPSSSPCASVWNARTRAPETVLRSAPVMTCPTISILSPGSLGAAVRTLDAAGTRSRHGVSR